MHSLGRVSGRFAAENTAETMAAASFASLLPHSLHKCNRALQCILKRKSVAWNGLAASSGVVKTMCRAGIEHDIDLAACGDGTPGHVLASRRRDLFVVRAEQHGDWGSRPDVRCKQGFFPAAGIERQR